MGKKRDLIATGRGKILGTAAFITTAATLLYFGQQLLPPPAPPPAPPPVPAPRGLANHSDPSRVELFCGEELCAYTWTGRPGVIAVTTSSGKETAQSVFQSYIDTRSGISMLPYITPMAERACKQFPNGNGLLIGLGGGAFPLILRRACPEGTRLTVVDASADALFIARTFVSADDRRITTYEKGFGQDFVAAAPPNTYDFIVNDAYDGMVPVPVFMEETFLRAARAALTPGGFYATNVLGDWINDKAVVGIVAVFGEADKARVEGTMNTWVMGYKKDGAGGSAGGGAAAAGGAAGAVRRSLLGRAGGGGGAAAAA